jgi:hypothetical protein
MWRYRINPAARAHRGPRRAGAPLAAAPAGCRRTG